MGFWGTYQDLELKYVISIVCLIVIFGWNSLFGQFDDLDCIFSVTLFWKKHAEDERYGDDFGYYVVRVHHSKVQKGTFVNHNII